MELDSTNDHPELEEEEEWRRPLESTHKIITAIEPDTINGDRYVLWEQQQPATSRLAAQVVKQQQAAAAEEAVEVVDL